MRLGVLTRYIWIISVNLLLLTMKQMQGELIMETEADTGPSDDTYEHLSDTQEEETQGLI